MHFTIVGELNQVETFATASAIRELARLRKVYGRGRWRKRKGVARVRLGDGTIHLAELHWYEASGIGKKEFKIKRFLWKLSMPKTSTSSRQLVICIKNDGYPASLEKRKIYVSLPDATAEKHKQLRVIDESGEDYLYPIGYFISLTLPQSARRAVLTAA
jgi:hypothetical protein